jgi:hypothetical protein
LIAEMLPGNYLLLYGISGGLSIQQFVLYDCGNATKNQKNALDPTEKV